MHALAARVREVTEQAGVDAVGEALIEEALGEGAWRSFPDQVRQMFAQNGPAIVAESRGGFLQADAAALATIDQPVLLVEATDSMPEFREATAATADALPNARTSVVSGGHLINPAAPEVLAFVDEVLERR
jgi:pimeloyl-ACP methyl ester carboxylesterase